MKSAASGRVGPLSVQLSGAERKRLAADAKKRKLKVATAARVFLDEHLSELEDRAELSAAEEWQRAQAWATWDKVISGDARWVGQEEIDAAFAKAKAYARRDARP